MFFFFLKQKTAYEMRISDWSSDVCSSDLVAPGEFGVIGRRGALRGAREPLEAAALVTPRDRAIEQHVVGRLPVEREARGEGLPALLAGDVIAVERSEEHTSELQSLMRISYAVFCLKKKTQYKSRRQY